MSFGIFQSSCIDKELFIPDYNQQRFSSFQHHSQYDGFGMCNYNACQQFNSYRLCGQYNSYQVKHQYQQPYTSNSASLNSNYGQSLTHQPFCPNELKSNKSIIHRHNKVNDSNRNIDNSNVSGKSNVQPSTKLDKKIKKKINNSEPKKDTNTEKKSFKQKYKTEICHYWLVNGYCRFGNQCAFAHGNVQLKQKTHVPNNYKTQICKQFRQKMHCPYGARCQYLHESQSVQRGELPFTSMLRMNFQHLATRLQAQATAEDEDIFKTLMQKGAKFKNFYPRERLPIFKQICQIGRVKKESSKASNTNANTITSTTSSQLINYNLVYTNNTLQLNDLTKNDEYADNSMARKLSQYSEIISEGTAADSQEISDEVGQVDDLEREKQYTIHSDGDDEAILV